MCAGRGGDLMHCTPCDTKGGTEQGTVTEGSSMSIDTSGGHTAMDYREHVRTYSGFIKGTVALIVLVAAILVGMLVFLV